MTLTDRETSALIRLLGILQEHLEVLIDSNTPPGIGTDPLSRHVRAEVAKARRNWKQAEKFVSKCERAVKDRDKDRRHK